MGREIKRVPIDFDAPLGEMWEGYKNPNFKECKACTRGKTAAKILLESACTELTHSMDRFEGQDREELRKLICAATDSDDGIHRSKDMPFNFVSPSEVMWGILEGLDLNSSSWGECEVCGGSNLDPEVRDKYESWERYEPPKGDGWQVWETVSDGSPITPVFETKEELKEYLVTTGNIWDGPWGKEYTEKFFGEGGWAPTARMEI